MIQIHSNNTPRLLFGKIISQITTATKKRPINQAKIKAKVFPDSRPACITWALFINNRTT